MLLNWMHEIIIMTVAHQGVFLIDTSTRSVRQQFQLLWQADSSQIVAFDTFLSPVSFRIQNHLALQWVRRRCLVCLPVCRVCRN